MRLRLTRIGLPNLKRKRRPETTSVPTEKKESVLKRHNARYSLGFNPISEWRRDSFKNGKKCSHERASHRRC